MRITADTNTFLAVALMEPERDEIIRLTTGHELVAPDVLPFEIGNALTAMLKKKTLDAHELDDAWRAANAVSVELRRVDIPASLQLAAAHGLYAYDAYFLRCALDERAPLLTLDGGLKTVARQIGVSLVE